MLTPEQIACFKTFGFLFFRQAFSPEEMESLIQAAEDVWAQELGRPPEVEEDVHTVPFVEKHPRLMSLVDDDRIYRPLVQLMEDNFIWSGSEGNRGFRTGHTAHHWHADRPGEKELDYLRIKLMLYFDPMRKETGALRVIPGSHRLPLHIGLETFQCRHSERDPTFFGMAGSEVPCHAIETDPGDLVMFNHSLFHAVYGKKGQRRYIALKYAARPKTDAHLASLKRWSPYTFQPNEALQKSDLPRVRDMVEGLVELGGKAERVKTVYY